MARQLPDRPNLDQLKHQAKDLLRAARAQDAAALARFRALPAFAARTDAELARAATRPARRAIGHRARAWRRDVERSSRARGRATLEFAAATDAFVGAATDGRGRSGRTAAGAAARDRARESPHGAGPRRCRDCGAVSRRWCIEGRRGGGPRGWEPLHYVCHSCDRGTLGTARNRSRGDRPPLDLAGRGSEPAVPLATPRGSPACALGRGLRHAIAGAGRALLELGANPSDGVTLTLAASAANIPALELLRSHGADVNHPWATDGSAPLYAILQWSRTADGVRWLLAHGADPDPVFAANGETPLHAVAARLGRGACGRARHARSGSPTAQSGWPHAVCDCRDERRS